LNFLFLKLFKARHKTQNFGLLVGGGKENIAPVVTSFSGTFEEFSEMVDNEIFQGSAPRNVLEKNSKKGIPFDFCLTSKLSNLSKSLNSCSLSLKTAKR